MEYNFESVKLTNKNNKLMRKIKESKRFKNRFKKIIKKAVKR